MTESIERFERQDSDLGAQRPQILIVEDNRSLARGLALLFRDAGYEPVTFHDGTSAINFAASARFAAAIIDIHLPDINGLVLSKRLRDVVGNEVPIIVLSGDSSMEVLNSLPHVGATYFFCKPVNGTTLIERVQSLVQ